LDGFIRFAQSECRIVDPEVFIIGNGSIIAQCPPISDRPRTDDIALLSDLDYRIIRSMHLDARKQVADIAKDVGVSTKTIRKHLDRMIEANLLDMVTRGKTRGQKIIDFAMFVKVKGPDARSEVMKTMRNDPQYRLLNSWTLSNAPNMLYFEVQTETVDEMEEIVTGLRSSPSVDSVMTDINMEEHIFSTWRDDMMEKIEKKASGK
jgi:DNA-binding Lrp family transcriptional regulator